MHAASVGDSARISELQSPAALLHERDQRQDLEELDAYAYPILTLPNEITSEIFTHFLPPFPERSTPVGLLSPLILSHVCRQWRDAAISTPTLWNAIELILVNPNRRQQQFCLLKTWLSRSGNCPLSISLQRPLLEANDDIPSTVAFVEAIIHHTPRWYDMKLQLPYEELHLIEGPMPLLRTLELGSTEFTDAILVPPPVVLFDQAPNLKDVVLCLYFNPFCITLPWDQITTLSATLFDTEVVEILRHALNLEECSVWLYPSFEFIDPIPPLVHLRSLYILNESDCGGDTEDLFAALVLPSLQTLKICEPLLGGNPVNALSSLCPQNVQRIEVVCARIGSEDQYNTIFPNASVSVKYVNIN
ncbi:hypothetical protein C8R44DRAFT_171487 [Mycena epipterygia]|nr:hypothetical protein C8R44DRAFT_171487 [Mycena epipterygia]